jgi:hypothetical protein
MAELLRVTREHARAQHLGHHQLLQSCGEAGSPFFREREQFHYVLRSDDVAQSQAGR